MNEVNVSAGGNWGKLREVVDISCPLRRYLRRCKRLLFFLGQ